MPYTLNIRAFFFNAKTDYLPYYKNFTLSFEEDATLMNLLNAIQEKNEMFSFPQEKLLCKINDIVIEGDKPLVEIVERLGTTLQIDPVLSYRSNNGLIINDEDFMQQFQKLAPYATDEDKAFYQSLYGLHYASESFKFSHDYIGDAMLVLADRMIENQPENKEAILEAILDPYDGLSACEYENNLFQAQDHTQAIERLNAMVKHPSQTNFLEKVATSLSKKALHTFEKESLEGINVACYNTDTDALQKRKEALTLAGANVISYPRESKKCGVSLIGKQNTLAFLKAATTLLEALDSGASVLVVDNQEALEMFENHFASIQKRIGREIPLALLSSEACDRLLS